MGCTGREANHAGNSKRPRSAAWWRSPAYFHDGRARTLEEVLAHYDRGVLRSPNLDPNLAKRGALNLRARAETRPPRLPPHALRARAQPRTPAPAKFHPPTPTEIAVAPLARHSSLPIPMRPRTYPCANSQ